MTIPTLDPSQEPSRLKAFPVAFVTEGKTLLLVGGTSGSLCRLNHALRFDWHAIHVVLAKPGEEPCETCLADPRVTVSRRAPTEEDIRAADLVMESTFDEELAATIAPWCKAHGVPLNAMDKLPYCDLYYTSLVFRGPLVIAISSGGESPAVSSALRRWLEKNVGEGWSHAASLLGALRKRLPYSEERSALLKGLARDEAFLTMIMEDDVEGMSTRVDEAYDSL